MYEDKRMIEMQSNARLGWEIEHALIVQNPKTPE